MLDSTLGFVALTPVLAVILPLAAWHADGGHGVATKARLRVTWGRWSVIFTLFTGSGPLLHNAVAGPVPRWPTWRLGSSVRTPVPCTTASTSTNARP